MYARYGSGAPGVIDESCTLYAFQMGFPARVSKKRSLVRLADRDR